VDGEASADDLEQQTQLYRRAEQVLGKPEYGLIRQLINAKGSIAGARSVVEAASETDNPRAYIASVAYRRAKGNGRAAGNASAFAGLQSARGAHR
jgi:hypothetical protein